jgi:hypothetical protein
LATFAKWVPCDGISERLPSKEYILSPDGIGEFLIIISSIQYSNECYSSERKPYLKMGGD